MRKKAIKIQAAVLALLCCILLTGCGTGTSADTQGNTDSIEIEGDTLSADAVPLFSGEPFIEINDNVPEFSEEELNSRGFEQYSNLDELGRCGTAEANLSMETMPREERGSIGQIKPSGWHTVKYDHIDGNYLYNRCHLIGFQLSGENANEKNLITGTRYFNVEGMLPFEDMTADYIKETHNHVLYRVTPVYSGDSLVAWGVQMEAYSIEDEGEGICFNVFVYNIQPGVVIDYATGDSWLDDSAVSSEKLAEEDAIRGNMKSKIYHCPGQRDYEAMADSKNLILFSTEEEAQEAGYRKAKQ